MSIDQRTESLYEFMEAKFPSKQEATRTVWKMKTSELPGVLRDLPRERREAIVACYAQHIMLTQEKFPELLAQGYLWLKSCDPKTPQHSTDYAKEGSDFIVGYALPNWGYGYRGIKLMPKRKPLFVPIRRLKTDHMPERLRHYEIFRNIGDMLTRARTA